MYSNALFPGRLTELTPAVIANGHGMHTTYNRSPVYMVYNEQNVWVISCYYFRFNHQEFTHCCLVCFCLVAFLLLFVCFQVCLLRRACGESARTRAPAISGGQARGCLFVNCSTGSTTGNSAGKTKQF